ncbi:hypothetical protein UGMREWDR_CDS0038 [Aeromonas phage GomatiRiver_11]|nr:hypothetical protein UGMREWDR_CDS0038 [Aeromonas phage GomatiRiver_11]
MLVLTFRISLMFAIRFYLVECFHSHKNEGILCLT